MLVKTKIERTETIMFRLSKAEKAQLIELASKYDMTVSDLFRRVMLPKFIRDGVSDGDS